MKALGHDAFRIVAPDMPNGAKSNIHLSVSDPTDSSIFEYINGKLMMFQDTNIATDRFVIASSYINAVTQKDSAPLAVTCTFSVMRNVSVPPHNM